MRRQIDFAFIFIYFLPKINFNSRVSSPHRHITYQSINLNKWRQPCERGWNRLQGRYEIYDVTLLSFSSVPLNLIYYFLLLVNNPLLGTSSKLGLRWRRDDWHEQVARHDFPQNDWGYVCLQYAVHAVCVDGAAPKLPALCLPRFQRGCTNFSAFPLVWVELFWPEGIGSPKHSCEETRCCCCC